MTTWKLKAVSKQLGIPHNRLINQLKRDGYAKTGSHGLEPDYQRNASAECFVMVPTLTPLEVPTGIINKRGTTIAVTPKGFDLLARQYGHLAQEKSA